ncbi:hypothetical protein J8273_7550 [Carpediemonas membranifera]|uniref:Uncharacterized protein n=1 Tax=Carpediemonas membranifera TaxID=201153 RepID=A0A8J6E067_9EUKA|nr:hypothetical protein J8273_7550 [Carpediemonas membranifera]|eukprot:KAG9391361.1 hypothetical protein J8273_7550 [Carpediemonas membranifera]
MCAVGFEPTPPKRLAPEASALDRSAKRTACHYWQVDSDRRDPAAGTRIPTPWDSSEESGRGLGSSHGSCCAVAPFEKPMAAEEQLNALKEEFLQLRETNRLLAAKVVKIEEEQASEERKPSRLDSVVKEFEAWKSFHFELRADMTSMPAGSRMQDLFQLIQDKIFTPAHGGEMLGKEPGTCANLTTLSLNEQPVVGSITRMAENWLRTGPSAEVLAAVHGVGINNMKTPENTNSYCPLDDLDEEISELLRLQAIVPCERQDALISPIFPVIKKDGVSIRLIHDLRELNSPPNNRMHTDATSIFFASSYLRSFITRLQLKSPLTGLDDAY